jgi:hypothetical protein
MLHKIVPICLAGVAGLALAACQPKAETGAPTMNTTADNAAMETSALADTNATVAAPANCGISEAKEWKAIVNAQGPQRPRLSVSGTLIFNTSGYKTVLERNGTDFNVKIATLELTITPPAPGTPVMQVLTPLKVETKVPDVVRDLEKVTINCGGQKLTDITDIEVVE